MTDYRCDNYTEVMAAAGVVLPDDKSAKRAAATAWGGPGFVAAGDSDPATAPQWMAVSIDEANASVDLAIGSDPDSNSYVELRTSNNLPTQTAYITGSAYGDADHKSGWQAGAEVSSNDVRRAELWLADGAEQPTTTDRSKVGVGFDLDWNNNGAGGGARFVLNGQSTQTHDLINIGNELGEVLQLDPSGSALRHGRHETGVSVEQNVIDDGQQIDLRYYSNWPAVGVNIHVDDQGGSGSFINVQQATTQNGLPTISTNGDIAISSNAAGLILMAPDGSSHRLTVANDGTLSTTPIA